MQGRGLVFYPQGRCINPPPLAHVCMGYKRPPSPPFPDIALEVGCAFLLKSYEYEMLQAKPFSSPGNVFSASSISSYWLRLLPPPPTPPPPPPLLRRGRFSRLTRRGEKDGPPAVEEEAAVGEVGCCEGGKSASSDPPDP